MSNDPEPGYNVSFQHGFFVSDRMLSVIGLTVVCQSMMESELGLYIQKLANFNATDASVVTATMSFRSLSDSLDALMHGRLKDKPAWRDRYKKSMSALRSFEQFRNQVAHSIWTSELTSIDHAIRIKALRGKVGGDTPTVTFTEISAQVTKAREAMMQMALLVHEVIGKPLGSTPLKVGPD